MPKPLKTVRVSTPDRKGVFEQGAKALRAWLYARVSTHDQKTLPSQGTSEPGNRASYADPKYAGRLS